MKLKVFLISIVSILFIAGIISAIIFLSPKSTTENKDNNQNQVIDNIKNNEEQNNISEDNKPEENKENNNKEENNKVEENTNTSTKSNTKKNNSSNTNSNSNNTNTNNTSNNNQPSKPTSTPEQPKETTPVVTETKYYAQCSLGSLESGKKLTASQIKAKYPVGESNTQGQSVLHSDLDKIAPQTGLSRDAFDAYQGACKWVSTDNKETLGYTMVVYIAVSRNFDKWQTINTELYNKYLNAWNSLTYYNWDSSHRIIGEYYLNNHQWKYNPNGFHF